MLAPGLTQAQLMEVEGIFQVSTSTPTIRLFDSADGEKRTEGWMRENLDDIWLEALYGKLRLGAKVNSNVPNDLVIGRDGKVGIGTDEPNRFLTVKGSELNDSVDFAITSSDALMELGVGKGGPHGFVFGDQDANEGMKLLYRSTPNELRIEPGNDIANNSTGLFRFAIDGAFYALDLNDIGSQKTMKYNTSTGEIGFDNSSRRYKTNIQTLEDNWSKILQTRPVRYVRPRSPHHWEYGYIAEEMDSIGLTNLVGYDKAGLPDDVKYDRMVIYLTEVIKDQQLVIEKLVSDNDLHKSRMSNLGQRMIILENYLGGQTINHIE